jgi:hypothetical protein
VQTCHTRISSQFSLVRFSSVALTTASSKMLDWARNMVCVSPVGGGETVRAQEG